MSKEELPFLPQADCVLVALSDSDYGTITTTEKKYDTRTSGLVVKVGKQDDDYLNGCRVFFEEYRDGVRVERDDKTYAFIKVEDIRGSEIIM